jgi:hypothetical protein
MSAPARTAIVVREDPRLSARPAEALRIAVGLGMGEGQGEGEGEVEIVLLGPAARVLAEDVSDLAGADLLVKHRGLLARAGRVFLVEEEALAARPAAPGLAARPVSEGRLAEVLAGASRHILF